MRLGAIARRQGRDPGPFVRKRRELHDSALAAFTSRDSAKPLAALLGVQSSVEQTFESQASGDLLVAILASSTPCYDIWGWIEVRLDDRHIQTVYLDDTQPWVYFVPLRKVAAGSHTLSIHNLTDAMDDSGHDRNSLIYAIHIYAR
jgi:hypothetical protein